MLSTPHQGGRTWFYNSPHLHGYQVVISRGLKCGLNPIRGYSTEAWNPPKYLVSPERIALAGIPAVPRIEVERQVSCQAGIADVVTRNAIYEIKLHLNKTEVFKAIGQVLLYRQCINPNCEAIIVCKSSQVRDLYQVIKELDVQIFEWEPEQK
ncbi:hypothetical protein H6G98_28575 [Nostoc sp. FACHB-857]|nr:hypothetical protein [Nostoc sp. FACHB-857]